MDTENTSSVELRVLCYKIYRIKFIYKLNEQKVKKRRNTYLMTRSLSLLMYRCGIKYFIILRRFHHSLTFYHTAPKGSTR